MLGFIKLPVTGGDLHDPRPDFREENPRVPASAEAEAERLRLIDASATERARAREANIRADKIEAERRRLDGTPEPSRTGKMDGHDHAGRVQATPARGLDSRPYIERPGCTSPTARRAATRQTYA